MSHDLDVRVRSHVYGVTMQRGYPPTIAEISAALSLAQADVRATFERLAAGRALVLQPGSGEILMAEPFSAVPTPFVVEVGGFSCYGNCIWDALGVAVMLKQEARIKTACGDCGMALQLTVAGGLVAGDAGVAHFAVPARHWWNDVVFT